MPTREGSRKAARELIVRALYSDLSGGSRLPDNATDPLVRQADLRWRDEQLRAIQGRLEELDETIALLASRSLSEIDRSELCILRLAGHELGFCPDIPWKVAIDEAVRLARIYCGPDSYRFVNGIAEKMAFKFRSLTPAGGKICTRK